MKTSVKFILTFLLLMLSFSMRGMVLNHAELSSCTCQITAFTSDACISSHCVDEDIYYHSRLQTLSFSDVEFGAKPLSESYSFSHNQRLRRMLEFSVSLRTMLHKLCLRENLLVLDKSKSFHSDKDPVDAQTCCEYYVFALRHILI